MPQTPPTINQMIECLKKQKDCFVELLAVARLQKYDWPGNVRELENALMRAAIVARGTVIGADHLILEQAPEPDVEDLGDLTLSSVVDRHIRMVLDRHDGDVSAASGALGITKKEVEKYTTD